MSTGVPRLLGSGPGAIRTLAFSSLSPPVQCAYRKFSLPTVGKNKVSPVLNFTVTPFNFRCTYTRYWLPLSGKEDGS